MKTEGFHDLLERELKNLYSAEQQLVQTIPRMAQAVSSQALREAIENHLEETFTQLERLEAIFEELDVPYEIVEKCEGMKRLIADGEKILRIGFESVVLDAALICAAQRVKHYEIAGYGCARALAQQLGHDDIAELLQETLDEEGEADKKLSEIALNAANLDAVTANAASEE